MSSDLYRRTGATPISDLVARRAGAMCIAAGRHGDSAEWPCDRHLAQARWLLGVTSSAVAPASFGVAPQPRTEGASGAAGRVPVLSSGQAGGSTSRIEGRCVDGV